MKAPVDGEVKVIATKRLKTELLMLTGISKIFEKVPIQEMLKLYAQRGGNKKDVEDAIKGQ